MSTLKLRTQAWKGPLNIIYQAGLLFATIAGAGVGSNGVCCVCKSVLIAKCSSSSVAIRLDSLIQVYRTLTQRVVIETLHGQCNSLARPLAHIMRIFTFLSTTDLERSIKVPVYALSTTNSNLSMHIILITQRIVCTGDQLDSDWGLINILDVESVVTQEPTTASSDVSCARGRLRWVKT